MITPEAIEKFLSLGYQRPAIITPPGGDNFFIKQNGENMDVSGFYPPTRIKQKVTLLDADSFADYVNLYRSKDETTMIFANVGSDSATFRAVLDYHGEKPGWCNHIAEFTTQETPEWKIWKSANRKRMSQVEFATWLEDNLGLFVSPPGSGAPSGANLLELVTSLHGHQNARFNNSIRLKTGAYCVRYDDDIEIKGHVTSQSESMELPSAIIAGIKMFHGCPAYQVQARLKTGIAERKLSIWFETISLPNLIRESLYDTVERIGDITKIVPLIGSLA